MRLVILDANALIHRAYHALPSLSNVRGEPTGAIYGFFSSFIRMVNDLKPDYLVAAFDTPELTFRHKEFKAYKAHRPKTPPDLAVQLKRGREEAQLKERLSHFTKIQSFNVEVPAVTDVKAYNESSVKARIIENTVYSAISYEKALTQSKSAVQNELGEDERLWDIPVNAPDDPQSVEFPLLIRWFVYRDADVTRLFLNEINKLNTQGTKYLLNTIEIQEVKASLDPHIFSLSGSISIALDTFISLPQENQDRE